MHEMQAQDGGFAEDERKALAGLPKLWEAKLKQANFSSKFSLERWRVVRDRFQNGQQEAAS